MFVVNDIEDVFIFESDEDVFGDGLGMKMCLFGCDSKLNFCLGIFKFWLEVNILYLKFEVGILKWGSKYIFGLLKLLLKLGMFRIRLDIGILKLKMDVYFLFSVKFEGEGLKVGFFYEFGFS